MDAARSAVGSAAGSPRGPSTPKRPPPSEAGPSRRPNVPSPAYISRRHSLYGTEDRVVIDPGARVWKIGLSGEPDARAAFWAAEEGEAWSLDLGSVEGAAGNRTEARRIVHARVRRKLRDVFHKHLLIDGKARKVIVVENTFLPMYAKEEIARVLFDNLRVPSVAFTPSSLLALAACGRITGLVVDVGWLETTVTPVYGARPLYHFARSTRMGGKALFQRVTALLRHYGRYTPPPPAGGTAPQPTLVPLDVLSDRLVERVITEACFVAPSPVESSPSDQIMAEDMDLSQPLADIDNSHLLAALAERYASSTSSDWTMTLPSTNGVGRSARLTVPGWVRECAAEVLFADGPDEDSTPAELVLTVLSKLPVDLRPEMVSSLLVTGGNACMPGFIPRLRGEILRLLPAAHGSSAEGWRHRPRHADLAGLGRRLAILNDPAPLDGESGKLGGDAPRWAPHLLPWIGASLAGVLKTSSAEIERPAYDTAMNDSHVRGEIYRAQMIGEYERLGLAMAEVGLSIDELRPGMAKDGLLGQRKRGWAPGGGCIPDWSTARVRAGV